MSSSGMKRYHLEPKLSSGTTCYHLGWNIIIWYAMLSSGANVVIWDKILSSGANVLMVSSGANVIIWCYHVMLSSGMITPPFFVFPGNFTHSSSRHKTCGAISAFLGSGSELIFRFPFRSNPALDPAILIRFQTRSFSNNACWAWSNDGDSNRSLLLIHRSRSRY